MKVKKEFYSFLLHGRVTWKEHYRETTISMIRLGLFGKVVAKVQTKFYSFHSHGLSTRT